MSLKPLDTVRNCALSIKSGEMRTNTNQTTSHQKLPKKALQQFNLYDKVPCLTSENSN